jgi:hypothetical protein
MCEAGLCGACVIDWLSVAYAAHNPAAPMPAVVKHYHAHNALPRVVTRELNTPRARHCISDQYIRAQIGAYVCHQGQSFLKNFEGNSQRHYCQNSDKVTPDRMWFWQEVEKGGESCRCREGM